MSSAIRSRSPISAGCTVKQPITFISYSRRQLYFAESLALHLQKEGIDAWFDLQQLQAGTVWSEGLKNGVSEASLMVLVVSQASLASPYTQAEWKGFAGKGNQLVLAIYEPVDLPDELRDLPVYDFRSGFNSKLRVKEGDKVTARQRVADMGKTPSGKAQLHFEIRRNGQPVDPVRYLPRR